MRNTNKGKSVYLFRLERKKHPAGTDVYACEYIAYGV